jgi:nucleoside-diphosphate-sugar epimerase
MIWRAASSPAGCGATLNVGTAEPEIAVGELARLIAATVGKEIEIVSLPPTPGSPQRRCPDMTRTRELTGYEPQVELSSGLERTYAWYRAHVFTRG